MTRPLLTLSTKAQRNLSRISLQVHAEARAEKTCSDPTPPPATPSTPKTPRSPESSGTDERPLPPAECSQPRMLLSPLQLVPGSLKYLGRPPSHPDELVACSMDILIPL